MIALESKYIATNAAH